MKKLLILASLAAAAATTLTAPTMAGQPVARSQTVSYTDIDLGSAKGAAELKRRVRVAVENVCGEASMWDLTGQNQVNRCYRETRERASLEVSNAIARNASQGSIRIADAR